MALPAAIHFYVGPYAVSEHPWVAVGESVSLVRRGPTVVGVRILPDLVGTVKSVQGQSAVVAMRSSTITVAHATQLPRLGLAGLPVGQSVILMGTAAGGVLGLAGTPATHRLVVAALNAATGLVTVTTPGVPSAAVPYLGPPQQLRHVRVGHRVTVYQAPDGQWIGVR